MVRLRVNLTPVNGLVTGILSCGFYSNPIICVDVNTLITSFS